MMTVCKQKGERQITSRSSSMGMRGETKHNPYITLYSIFVGVVKVIYASFYWSNKLVGEYSSVP